MKPIANCLVLVVIVLACLLPVPVAAYGADKVTVAESGKSFPKIKMTVRMPEECRAGETIRGKGWLTYDGGKDGGT